MNSTKFVDKDLIKLKNRLTSSATNTAPKDVSPVKEIVEQISPINNETHARSKAIANRYEEYLRIRKEVLENIYNKLSLVESESIELNIILDETTKLKDNYKKFIEVILVFDDSKWEEMGFESELTRAMRTIENVRLEILKSHKELMFRSDDLSNSASMRSINIKDMEPTVLFKAGFYFFLPVVLGIMIAAGLLAWAIVFSLGGLF